MNHTPTFLQGICMALKRGQIISIGSNFNDSDVK